MAGRGILRRSVRELPIAVIDMETTGLSPGWDRVVEVSVVRLEPDGEPRLVFDTLVNPCRRMAATEIHGITDADVAQAPRFRELAGDLVRALSGCVVAAYNVYFDIRFLTWELQEAGLDRLPPHLCVMYLRPMLGLGSKCCLEDACQAHGISHATAHMASVDAQAAAALMALYLAEMAVRGIETFKDLAALRDYKFVRSFRLDPVSDRAVAHLAPCDRLTSRVPEAARALPVEPGEDLAAVLDTQAALRQYWEGLKAALADLTVTDDEVRSLRQKRERLGLDEEQVRALHARALMGVISHFVGDGRLDDRECRMLQRLQRCLSDLGWAPGEA